MGCISSKLDINDQHPNIFQVTNVDEMGHFVSPGQLEVTETELILHQRGKPPTRWPVRCLRKYGFDSEIFSFESGRRCPTGAGIYAFRCRKAEQLFNMLQQNIQLRNLNEDNNVGLNSNVINAVSDFPVPLASTGPPVVHRRLPSISDGYLNPTINTTVAARPHPCLSRPGSVTSNGPVSPVSPPPNSETSFEHNNNTGSLILDHHSYTNTNPINTPTYINLELAVSPTITGNENYVNVIENTHPLYMNVVTSDNHTKDVPKILNEVPIETEQEDLQHCYANVNVNDLDFLVTPETPNASMYVTPIEVNYVELDLENTKAAATAANAGTGTGNPNESSPSKVKKSYATIDFNKTNALSQSVNQRMENDQGIRKTRHNSTISDVPTTRHSNSSSD